MTEDTGNTWDVDVDSEGEFVRKDTEFRHWITRSGDSGFAVEPGRYHLYVSHACPWAHRTLIGRALKGLESAIGVSVVHPFLDDRGWHFEPEFAGTDTRDQLYGAKLLRERYDEAVDGRYSGRITVPVLWDREQRTIVNNESAEILRMMGTVLDELAEHPELDLYPEPLRAEIDELNRWIYEDINNGVYRCGFATSQAAYERSYHRLFTALDRVEDRLSRQRYLTGSQLTEADIRLFTTLLRFDPVYHNHFRCNRNKIREREALWGFVLDVAQQPGVLGTIFLDHIKFHYYSSHESLNPKRIVPVGPEMDLRAAHGREAMGGPAAR